MGYSRQDYGDYMALPHRATVAIKLTHRERATLAVRWEEIKEHLIQTEPRDDHTQIHRDVSVLIKEYVTRIVVAPDLFGVIKKKKKKKDSPVIGCWIGSFAVLVLFFFFFFLHRGKV